VVAFIAPWRGTQFAGYMAQVMRELLLRRFITITNGFKLLTKRLLRFALGRRTVDTHLPVLTPLWDRIARQPVPLVA